MSVKLLTEHNLEFLSLKGGCTGPSESKLVKIPHCWKSHALAQLFLSLKIDFFLVNSRDPDKIWVWTVCNSTDPFRGFAS